MLDEWKTNIKKKEERRKKKEGEIREKDEMKREEIEGQAGIDIAEDILILIIYISYL